MNLDINYNNFIQIWCEKIKNIFKNIEIDDDYFIEYEYSYYLNRRKFCNSFDNSYGDNILENWFRCCKIRNIDIFIKEVYENILYKDLDLLIRMISILTRFPNIENRFKTAIDLINFYNESNLEFYEFMSICYDYNNLNLGITLDYKIKFLYKQIQREHKCKINKLYQIWEDYNGNYKTYLEWVPRETLEDL